MGGDGNLDASRPRAAYARQHDEQGDTVRKPITVLNIVRLMRLADDAGVVTDTNGDRRWITDILREHGATPEQAAKAARRLRWTANTADDWDGLAGGTR